MAMSTAEKKTIKDAIELIERETNSDGDTLMLRGFASRSPRRRPATRRPAARSTCPLAASCASAPRRARDATCKADCGL